MPGKDRKKYIENARKIVLKLGTKVLLDHYQDINKKSVDRLVEDIVYLREKGYEFSIVSSGAVGFGMRMLEVDKRPTTLKRVQALASVGQNVLMDNWTNLFQAKGIHVGQILLTYDIIENRQRFLYARDCLKSLIGYGAIPIVNENDSVAVDELKFGDNDLLSALTANLMDADLLILFTDTDGLFDKNPHQHPDARRLSYLDTVTDDMFDCIEDKQDDLSIGGMGSKLKAAQLSTGCGTGVVITNGCDPRLREILSSEDIGTFIKPGKTYAKKRKKWIFFNQKIKGRLYIDSGAETALLHHLKSLLPGGVVRIEKDFPAGSIVGIFNTKNEMIGKGISYYSSKDIDRIKGHKSDEIEAILGKPFYSEIIHRDNMIIL